MSSATECPGIVCLVTLLISPAVQRPLALRARSTFLNMHMRKYSLTLSASLSEIWWVEWGRGDSWVKVDGGVMVGEG